MYNMYPAFTHPVSLRAYPRRRVDHMLDTKRLTVMKARRPGTRSYNFSFRHGTLYSRSGNTNITDTSFVPDSPSQGNGVEHLEHASTTPTAKTSRSPTPPNFEKLASTTARNATPPSRGQPEIHKAVNHSPQSVSFRFPFFGTVRLPGTLVLMFVPVLWSSYSIVVKWLYRLPWALNPVVFNFLRLLVGSVMVLPMFTPKTVTKPIITAGVELGFWTVLANNLQIYGLRHTTASRAAFLSQLSTVLVPLIAVAVGMENRLASSIILAAPLSLLGVALLTLDGAAPSPIGDGIMLSVACVSACYILRSKRYTHLPSGALVASKTIFQALFAGIFLLLTTNLKNALSFAGASPLWLAVNAALVLYVGFFIGFLSTVLQIRGQAVVSASETAVVFTTNPLWASLLAIPLGERFGPKGFAGASIILLATALASGIFGREKRQEKVGELG